MVRSPRSMHSCSFLSRLRLSPQPSLSALLSPTCSPGVPQPSVVLVVRAQPASQTHQERPLSAAHSPGRRESEGPTNVGRHGETGGRHTTMRAIRNRVSREDGVAAVEFALILPVLALLLFGTLEFGRVWSQYQLYQGAAREGARCAAVKADPDCVIQDEIKQAAAPFDVSKPASVSIIGGPSGPCTTSTVGQDVQVSWQ